MPRDVRHILHETQMDFGPHEGVIYCTHEFEFPNPDELLMEALRFQVTPMAFDASGHRGRSPRSVPVFDRLGSRNTHVGTAYIRELTLEQNVPVLDVFYHNGGFAFPGRRQITAKVTVRVNFMRRVIGDVEIPGIRLIPHFLGPNIHQFVFVCGHTAPAFVREYMATFPDELDSARFAYNQYRARQMADAVDFGLVAPDLLEEEPVEESKGPPLESPFDD